LFFRYLQSDKLCLDTSDIILDALLDYIKSDGGPEVMQLWSGISQHINQIYYEVDSKISEKNNVDLCENKLAMTSTDNIWIKKKWDIQEKISKKLKYISLDRYIKPKKEDILLRNGRIVPLKKGDNFPLFGIIKKCLISTDILIIRDPYIITAKISIHNARTFIQMAPAGCKVEICTYSDKERNRGRKSWDSHKTDKLSELLFSSREKENKVIKINKQSKKDLHDRSIETNDWLIMLGGGLDRHNGNTITRETTISLLKKNK